MNIAAYLDEVRRLYKSGETTEHSFRQALARLILERSETGVIANKD